MRKEKIEELLLKVDNILIKQCEEVRKEFAQSKDKESLKKALLKHKNDSYYIESGYKAKVASLGVSLVQSGLLATLTNYFNESSEIKTRPILEVLARTITGECIGKCECEHGKECACEKYTFNSACTLVKFALKEDTDRDELKKKLIEAGIALKLIIRTYDNE